MGRILTQIEIATPAVESAAGPRRYEAVIDGEEVLVDNLPSFLVTEPAIGRRMTEILAADAGLVDRASLICAVAQRFRDHSAELEELDALEVGRPLHIAESAVAVCHGIFDQHAQLAETLQPKCSTTASSSLRRSSKPMASWPESFRQLAAESFRAESALAVAAGNTVVLRPGNRPR